MFDKNLLKLLGKDKNKIYIIVLLNILSMISNISITLSICWIIENLIRQNYQFIYPVFIILIMSFIRYILNVINGRVVSSLGANSKKTIRELIFKKIATLGNKHIDDLSLASLTQVSIEGVEQLDLYYSTYIPQFFFAMISPVILFIFLMFISIPSAITLLCCVPLIPMSIIMVSKYAKKIFAKYWGQYTKMGDAFLDNISGMKELKIFNADQLYQNKMNSEAELFRKITMKVLTMQLFSTTIMDLVAYGGAALGIAICISTKQNINPLFNFSIPTLVLFIVLVAVDFFLPLRALGSSFHVSMNGATAGKKILKLLSYQEPTWGNEKIDGSSIKFSNVKFSYDKNVVLNDISFQVNKGELVCFVGESGCGKSTIINLITGFKQNYQGEILIGDKNIKSLSKEDYYSHLTYVSYDSYLFNDTIRNNFKIFNKNISDEEIYQLLEKVNLKDFILNNGGLDLVLLEGSNNISGGQRQRLVLACNLAKEKDIYLFDEVTSNIDVESEEIIMKNIYSLSKNKTVIMVSHRLNNVKSASKIFFLKDGKILEEGQHEDLLKLNGNYCKLFLKQYELENAYKED